ncbi:MAG TPA: hypothetical protein H9772_06945 [Candidatus Oscillibacter pullicola]|nr:hypothetical protein [Candidatus Oscillibacter pullicola]
MAGFEESDLYAAFGLEQPAGGNEPGAAEPGAQEGQAQGTEPGTGGVQEPEQDLAGHEPPAEPGEGEVRGGSGDAGDVSGAAPAEGGQAGAPAQQTKEQRAENAARRRREEQQAAIDAAVKKAVEDERARTKGQMEAFFAKAGMKNTVTGKPITTLEEFDAWQADYEAARLQKDLKAGKLTPEALRSAVEQTPAIQALKKQQEQQAAADEQRRQAEAKARVDAELAEIHKMDPTISTVEDLLSMPSAKAFYDLVRKGNSFLDAYRLANFDRLQAARAEAARQQAMNNARGKDHLTGTGTPQGTGAATVPPDEMRAFKLFNPTATEAEITAWYNKHKK